ncbi:MAG: ABC transporter permease subunit [Geminicoccaceae bacterium]|nr:ABC transporter permease subunit [Geminicoccaceae bacterium]
MCRWACSWEGFASSTSSSCRGSIFFVSAPISALAPILMILFGIGERTVVLSVVLFALWIVVLDAGASLRGIPPSLVEMARVFGAGPERTFFETDLWAALPEILACVRTGVIRGVEGVVVGQLLVSVVGFGQLFEIYSSRFSMEHFWALSSVLFLAAVPIAEGLAALERRIEHFASARHRPRRRRGCRT